ncbi:MAG: signal peptidase I [Selenomonadales bacterium]|jgi:signal peptidase I|nr:signal peptidase I [Selenomonadales bacterium]
MPKSWRTEVLEWGKAFALAIILALIIRVFLIEVYIVDGVSMQPSLQHGERVLVNKLVYRFGEPSPSDVVVFRYPRDRDRDFIKRVIAGAGQTVETRDNHVYVDGVRLTEQYLGIPTHGTFGPVVVPEGTVFVMGDNRNFSLDSRDPAVGFIPLAEIKGKAMLIFWPLPALRLVPN